MATVAAIGIFVSVILHEFAHAVVARRHGIQVSGIKLFIFGGVAEMEDEPPGPRAEFQMAIAGPLLSVALGLGFLAVTFAAGLADLPRPFGVVSGYLGWMNLILAGFNLVPGFPLDGGRVLRSLLWVWKDDYLRATRVATAIGSGFAVMLIFTGVLLALAVSPVGGIWWLMVGFFLNNASQLSYRHALVRHSLEGERVSGVMMATPVAVAPEIPLRSLVDDYFYRHHFQSFPVVSAGMLLGSVSTQEIKQVPRREWPVRTVGEILVPCGPDGMIGPEEPALRALTAMSRGGMSRLLVVDDGRLAGIVTLADLFRLVAVKLDLEEADRAPREDSPPRLPVFWSGRPARR
jgi:Zn-dependent protease/CBS domain-containing protein